MLPILAFLMTIGVFIGCVWYAVAHEDLTGGQKPSRLGPLSRALSRVRKGRSSPQATPAGQGGESASVHQCAELSSAPETERAPHSPSP